VRGNEDDLYLSSEGQIEGYALRLAEELGDPVTDSAGWDAKVLSYLARRATSFGTEGVVEPDTVEQLYREFQAHGNVRQRTHDEVAEVGSTEPLEVEGVFDQYLVETDLEGAIGALDYQQPTTDLIPEAEEDYESEEVEEEEGP